MQGCNLSGIMETQGDSSHSSSTAMGGYRVFRKDSLGRWVALYVREQLECLELCLEVDDEPSES